MNNSADIFQFDVLQVVRNGGKGRCLKEGERKAILTNQKRPSHPFPVWGACGTRDQREVLALLHTTSTRGGLAKANGHGCSSRAPRTFFNRIRASELRF